MKSKKVLIVEQDLALREMLSAVCAAGGFEATALADRHSALAWLVQEPVPPVRLVLDVSAPHSDNWALAEAVRANPRWRGIELALLSSSASCPGVRARRARVDRRASLLAMPFLVEQLMPACAAEPAPMAV